jgi:SNF2 family DNA or RNA helicase
VEINRRKKLIAERNARIRLAKDEALRDGRIVWKSHDTLELPELDLPAWAPVLIFAPSSVVNNWVEDFETWAHFSVAVYAGPSREAALQSVEDGTTEVLVCAHSKIQDSQPFHLLKDSSVKWKAIVVDEFHMFKNDSAIKTENLRALRDQHACVIIGLTGTLMQNEHKELWNLVDVVAQGHFGPWQQFEAELARPIKLSRLEVLNVALCIGHRFSQPLFSIFRTKDASIAIQDLGKEKALEISRKLYGELPPYTTVSQSRGS